MHERVLSATHSHRARSVRAEEKCLLVEFRVFDDVASPAVNALGDEETAERHAMENLPKKLHNPEDTICGAHLVQVSVVFSTCWCAWHVPLLLRPQKVRISFREIAYLCHEWLLGYPMACARIVQ